MMKIEMEGGHGMSGQIFKNRAVYPIKIGNIANSIIYAESIFDAEARNILHNRAGPEPCGGHFGGDELYISFA
jgi:hypothetical protein